MSAPRRTLSELAEYVGGSVVGDGDVEIRRVAPIEEAGAGDITFLAHPRYRAYLAACRASAVIVGPDLPGELAGVSGRNWLRVRKPYTAFAEILNLFSLRPQYDGRIHPLASVDPSAIIGDGVTVFPYVYVGKGVKVRRGSVLFPGVFLGDRVEVGEECLLHPQVTVREGCRVGNRVILHAGVVIGSDGFGYAGEGRERIKIPQVGIVEIEDDVEIGANTTIDRATLGRTIIRRGTKIDNLVQIAHNVVVGEDSIIAAQTGIAGSTRVGREVVLAGQVGVVNHVEIGDRARIGPKSGIPRSVPPGALLSGGVAAAPHHEWIKVMTLLPNLAKLWNGMRRLERKVAELGRRGRKGGKGYARRKGDL
ncbi:MAG: UDP-3-O-(3-hydroxymyristoyl)glucosamine N-acyltransferase [Deltaproteobacteria bacterium]|nr:UDP-3-O-(3-hydroxymyristoyl)glucosamine N-acyltransferase [Deltaproteobacteria bacterium]